MEVNYVSSLLKLDYSYEWEDNIPVEAPKRKDSDIEVLEEIKMAPVSNRASIWAANSQALFAERLELEKQEFEAKQEFALKKFKLKQKEKEMKFWAKHSPQEVSRESYQARCDTHDIRMERKKNQQMKEQLQQKAGERKLHLWVKSVKGWNKPFAPDRPHFIPKWLYDLHFPDAGSLLCREDFYFGSTKKKVAPVDELAELMNFLEIGSKRQNIGEAPQKQQ